MKLSRVNWVPLDDDTMQSLETVHLAFISQDFSPGYCVYYACPSKSAIIREIELDNGNIIWEIGEIGPCV